MEDKDKINWLLDRIMNYESCLRLKDLTFHADIPLDWEYCKKYIMDKECKRRRDKKIKIN